MEIYKYDSYGHYVREQTEANKLKIEKIYADKKNFTHFIERKMDAKSILCHGSRNGAELKYFAEAFKKHKIEGLKILGTDISDTATQFENTVQWDMMKRNPKWKGKWDIVYSNSFDHSFDPVATLKVWGEQLTPDGLIILEFSFHSKHQRTARAWDPIGQMTREDMRECIEQSGLVIKEEWSTQFGPAQGKGVTYFIGKSI